MIAIVSMLCSWSIKYTIESIFMKLVLSSVIFFGIYANMIYNLFATRSLPKLRYAWNVLLTFVFITSTRLFFRAGSNLDPAEANEVAWETARNMIHQIGSPWDLSIVPQQAFVHLSIILVFLLGMAIHWLPNHFKRWYRMVFCHLPVWAMIAFAVVACFVIYQFSSADSPPFIYFQF